MPEPEYLSPGELRILEAIADALIPPGGPFETGGRDIAVGPFFNRYLHVQQKFARIGLRILIHQWNWLPLLYFKSFKRFTSMTPAGRVAFMSDLSEDRRFFRRINVFVFKFMLCMQLYGDPQVEKAIGYRRHCLPAGDQAAQEAV